MLGLSWSRRRCKRLGRRSIRRNVRLGKRVDLGTGDGTCLKQMMCKSTVGDEEVTATIRARVGAIAMGKDQCQWQGKKRVTMTTMTVMEMLEMIDGDGGDAG